ncbi:MAG: squalene/phytoene synthase family protein [Elusimicrobia bacterium]|nr:squalene/phytoene synthase family protein [Elusimicrobiota bacterium]
MFSPSRSYEAGSSFRPAFFFLAPDQRRALSAFYGYARAVDDIADDPAAAPQQKEALLQTWRTRIEALFSGAAAKNPLEADLAVAIRTFSMRKANFLLTLDGVSMDIHKYEYATFDELKYYMYRVAGAVGLACLEIFRYRGEQGAAIAENLGYAVQLTNIIRDVFEDAACGRIYLPLGDLEMFCCDPRVFKNPVCSGNFIDLIKFEAKRARGFYAAARELAAGPEKKKLLSAFIMAEVYSGLLDKIEARGFKIAGGRVRLGGFGKIKAIYKAWRFIKKAKG